MPIHESPQVKDSLKILESEFDQVCSYPSIRLSCRIYQTRDEQEACGALVRLPVLPKLLQTESLPVQGPPASLTHRQGFLTVFNS